MTHHLTRADARRVAVRAQLLEAERPDGLLDLVEHLTLLQMDQTAHVAPSADLVAWSRLGSGYRPEELAGAIERGELVELGGMARPAADVALYRAEMAAWPGTGDPDHRLTDWQVAQRDWVAANDACRRDLLDLLEAEGPLPAAELPDTCVVPWRSSGWTNDQNVIRLLDFMVARGEVATAGREGRARLYDLASRVYPDDPVVPWDEARRVRDVRRLAALGIARARAAVTPGEPNDVGEAGEEAVVEGVRGRWRVDPRLLDGADPEPRAALLSPLDRLVFDRKRMTELWGFDYQLEMYKPAAKRRWGYWAMPVLYADRLVGKLDAAADRRGGLLRVEALHEDEPFTREMGAAVMDELYDLAVWLELELRVD
ncbi:MAG: DNA glycosylase AlkZ-like family protein [Nocardioides sp.]